MTTIHHAIVKAAAGKGVILTSPEDGTVEAKHAETGVTVRITDIDEDANVNDVAKEAHANAQDIVDFMVENPTIRIAQEDGDFTAFDKTADNEFARDPDLADLFETVREYLESGASVDGDEDEEETASGSVVPDTFKKRYAEAGHPDHCGDWLANTLNDFCRIVVVEGKTKEKFDIGKMQLIAEANGLSVDRYLVNQTRGFEGRFRMTVRNILAKVVAVKGVLHVPAEANRKGEDLELVPPAGWGAKYRKPEAADGEKPAPAKKAAVTKAK